MSAEFLHDFWASIDADAAIAALDQVENKRKQVEGGVKETEKASSVTFLKVRRAAMAAWNMVTNVLEMAGISMPKILSAVVSGAISVSTTLGTLASAQAATPFMQWAAALAAVGVGMSIGAAIQGEQEGAKIASDINSILNNVRGFAGGFY